jgi:hypothetical protein
LDHSGSLARMRIDPAKPQPFSLDTVFAENMPSVGAVKRMWVDPAGRICLASQDSQLIIFYVEGHIPPAMLDLIPANELKQAKPKLDK